MKLDDPSGRVLGEVEAKGSAVARLVEQPTVPTMLYGFAIRVGIGPYPPDAERSHRRAVYAEFTPVEEPSHSILAKVDRERVLGMVPLTAEGADAIAADPNGDLAERAANDAVSEAVKIIRRVHGEAS